MIVKELESAVEELFPGEGNRALAAALEVDYTTVWRYFQRSSVPGPVKAAISAWLKLQRQFGIAPPKRPAEKQDLEEMVEMASPGFRRESGLSGVEATAFLIFGEQWKKKLSSALEIDSSTLWRQISSDSVSGPVMASLKAWVMLKRMTGEVPEIREKRQSIKRIPKYARLLLEDE